MRAFTWWRRFYSVRKLPKKYLFKGASELLQRIEFGEYEFNHLGREVYLEDKIFEYKRAQIIAKSPWLKGEALEERLEYDRKQRHKRKLAIMSAHLEAEDRLIAQLAKGLSSEFDLEYDFIMELMESFDGTTRELYFKCMSLATGKEIDPEKMQRFFQAQPVHILKPKEQKYLNLWLKLVKERNWQSYLNWDQIK